MFVILNVVFLSFLIIFLTMAMTGNGLNEKIYAKKICLAIDSMKPGTEIALYLPKLFDIAQRNNFNGEIVSIDYSKGTINVKVADDEGYTFNYFTKLDAGSFSIDANKQTIYVKT